MTNSFSRASTNQQDGRASRPPGHQKSQNRQHWGSRAVHCRVYPESGVTLTHWSHKYSLAFYHLWSSLNNMLQSLAACAGWPLICVAYCILPSVLHSSLFLYSLPYEFAVSLSRSRIALHPIDIWLGTWLSLANGMLPDVMWAKAWNVLRLSLCFCPSAYGPKKNIIQLFIAPKWIRVTWTQLFFFFWWFTILFNLFF